MIKGIDVSKWNGKIDWKKVKKSGIKFAIIREGYGKKSPVQIDKCFKENMEGAKNEGINVGIYHYSYADNTQDAISEAQFCLENIHGYKLEYPVVFDIEDKEMLKLSNRERTNICKAFCEEIEKNGYYVMIYTNKDWIDNYLCTEELFSKYDLWLADWYKDTPSYSCGIWQYSSMGRIDGIKGNVDLNIAYNDYSNILKKHIDSNKTGDLDSSSLKSFINYTVKSGDNLWSIASEFLGKGELYTEIKRLNNLTNDKIYPHQILKLPYKTYKVKKGDSLWSIAEKCFGDGNKYKKIKEMNELGNDTIYPGQVLKI